MIRKFNEKDIDNVMELWLKANIEAHNFIHELYWKSNFDTVKKMMYDAELYVYEEEGKTKAFVGLINNYIAGIFVDKDFRFMGIGSKLIDYIKNIKNELTLNVYVKNKSAINFYLKKGFKIIAEETDYTTGEKEYIMKWC